MARDNFTSGIVRPMILAIVYVVVAIGAAKDSAGITTIVVPAGMRSIARMRACLVSGRFAAFEDEAASRVRDLDLLVIREAERAAALGFDLSLVIESAEVRATLSGAPPQPRRANHPAGRDPLGALRARPSRHSNAPIKDKSQSFLSK
jgi:hypothetical protein